MKQSVSNDWTFWSLERTVFLTTPFSHSFYSCCSFISHSLFHFLGLYILFHLCLYSILIKGGGGNPWAQLWVTVDFLCEQFGFLFSLQTARLHYLVSRLFCPQGPSKDTCFMIRATTCMIIRLCPFFGHACRSTDSGGLASWVIRDLGIRSLICSTVDLQSKALFLCDDFKIP